MEKMNERRWRNRFIRHIWAGLLARKDSRELNTTIVGHKKKDKYLKKYGTFNVQIELTLPNQFLNIRDAAIRPLRINGKDFKELDVFFFKLGRDRLISHDTFFTIIMETSFWDVSFLLNLTKLSYEYLSLRQRWFKVSNIYIYTLFPSRVVNT